MAWVVTAEPVRAGEPRWKKHTINGESMFEAAGALDVDNDGKLDIVSGDTWYRAPEWKRSKVRDVEKVGTYYNCFATLPIDVNGDARTDYVTCTYFSRAVGWVENPGVPGKLWTYHAIDSPGPCEAAIFAELTGEGPPEILPNSVNVVTWYTLEGQGSTAKWVKHQFDEKAAGHGVGAGDVNGDRRADILTPTGWFEGPASPKTETWPWHPEWKLGATGIGILTRDVDGDGLVDLVYGMGHNYGLFWLQQAKGPRGERTWTQREIDPSIASVHALIWADIDGDGKAHELVTGKRVYAHEVEPGDTDGSVVAWYDYDRSAHRWNRHIIFQGEPASNAPAEREKRNALKDFPAGTAGTGLQITAIDFDRDGDVDLLCPGKSGLYLFENLGTKP
jgi:hypothetical protein